WGGADWLLGLWRVNPTKDFPFWTVVSEKNGLLMVGGRATVKVAEADPPVPPLVALTGLVEFRYVPVGVAVTLTLTVHELFVASVPPVRETDPDPAVAVAVPPQLLVRPLGVATTRLAG